MSTVRCAEGDVHHDSSCAQFISDNAPICKYSIPRIISTYLKKKDLVLFMRMLLVLHRLVIVLGTSQRAPDSPRLIL